MVELGHALERNQDSAPVMDATAMPTRTDSKVYRKQRQKKIAQGHAPDDHEENQSFEIRM